MPNRLLPRRALPLLLAAMLALPAAAQSPAPALRFSPREQGCGQARSLRRSSRPAPSRC